MTAVSTSPAAAVSCLPGERCWRVSQLARANRLTRFVPIGPKLVVCCQLRQEARHHSVEHLLHDLHASSNVREVYTQSHMLQGTQLPTQMLEWNHPTQSTSRSSELQLLFKLRI